MGALAVAMRPSNVPWFRSPSLADTTASTFHWPVLGSWLTGAATLGKAVAHWALI